MCVGRTLRACLCFSDIFWCVCKSSSLLEYTNTRYWSPLKQWFSSITVLFFRPYCTGYEYEIVGAPKTISEYYSFHKPDSKAYECRCPSEREGDNCESVVVIDYCTSREFVYENGDGTCSLCDCSYLSLSEECDRLSGQCPCLPGLDVVRAGRQCVST